MNNYPEIRIYVSYDPYNYIMKWEFDTHNFSIDRYESYVGTCVANSTECVIDKLDESFTNFLITDGVKKILVQSRLKEM